MFGHSLRALFLGDDVVGDGVGHLLDIVQLLYLSDSRRPVRWRARTVVFVAARTGSHTRRPERVVWDPTALRGRA